MTMPGHNGGPPLVDEDDNGNIRMRYARIHISDILTGIRKMPLDARGFYLTGLFCMYDNMGCLPVDDRMAAMQMGCDLKTYRRFRGMMLDPKAFGDNRTRWSDTGDGLTQQRVQKEITDYCLEFKNRRDAALKREAEKKSRKEAEKVVAETSILDQGIAEPTLGPPKLAEMSRSEPKMDQSKTAHLSENVNEINGANTRAAPEQWQSEHQTSDPIYPKPKHKQDKSSEEGRGYVNVAVAPLTPPPLPQHPVSNSDEIIPPPMPSAALAVVAAPQPLLLEPMDEPRVPGRRGRAPVGSTEYDALTAFERYNELAQRIGLAMARSLTPQRRRALLARLREHGGLSAWDVILANVERSAFLRGFGGGRSGWRADLDFLLQAKSCAKVFDGGYGNGAHGGETGVETAMERTMRLCEEAGDRLGIPKGGI